MDDAQVTKLIDDKITELNLLTTRMDNTKSLLEDLYSLVDYNNKKIDDAISVTRNLPITHAETMANKLIGLEWQAKVESSNKLPKTLISHVEQFSDDVQAQIDEFIKNEHGISGGMNSWQSKKVVTRGPIGARYWLYYDKDALVIDALPLDMRWCPFELNEWGCPISRRTAAQIKAQYSKKGKDWAVSESLIPTSGNDHEVRSFCNDETEMVFVNGKKIAERPNIYKEYPFVFVMSSVGFQFRDSGYIEHESESFDWKNRNLYAELNRSASMLTSAGFYALYPGYLQSTKDKVSKPADQVPGSGEVARVAEGEEHKIVEKGKLEAAFVEGSRDLEADIARGGVADIESGNTEAPNTALLVTTVNALLSEKLKPYKDALADFKQGTLRKIISQYIKLAELKKGKEIDLGRMGMKHRYSAKELGDPSTYQITYIPMLNSKDQNIANVAVAGAQRGLLPDEFILSDTLQVQDVSGMTRKMEMQKAKSLDPSIGLIEQAIAFAEEAEDLEGIDADIANMKSMQLYDSAITILKQRDMALQPVTPGTQEVPKPNMQGIMGLGGAMPTVGGNGGGPEAEASTKVVAK